MTHWIIKQSHPGDSTNEIVISSSEVKVSRDISTIYDAVSWFEKNALPKFKKGIKRKKLKKGCKRICFYPWKLNLAADAICRVFIVMQEMIYLEKMSSS